MAIEVLGNNAVTTLNGGINNSQTTLVVASATGFPTTGNFRILIDSEYMLVTGVSGGTTFTVSRGIESSTAVLHSNGATVANVLTAGWASQTRADTISRGAFGSLPAAGAQGRIYLATDTPVGAYDDGANWNNFGPVNHGLTDPNLSTFGWINQGSATVTSTHGGIYVSQPQLASDSLAIYETTLNSNAAGTSVTFLLAINGGGKSTRNWHCGFSLRAPAASTKVATFAIGGGNANAGSFWYFAYTNPTTFSSSVQQTTFLNLPCPPFGYFWVRRVCDSTNQYWQTSSDGITWGTCIGGIVVANGLDAAPTKIGVYLNDNSSQAFADPLSIHLLSLLQQ